MKERLIVSMRLMSQTGSIYVNVNDIEDYRLRAVMDQCYRPENYVTTVVTKCSTVSSFRTVNPGPVDITDRILFYAKDKDSMSFTPQPVEKQPDISHFSRYVTNLEDRPECWEFESIKLRVLNDMGFTCSTTREGMKLAAKSLGASADVIIEAQCKAFAVEHAESVFETKTFQKPSTWLLDWIKKSTAQPEKVMEVKREGAEPIVMMGGRQFYFLSRNIQIINGKKCVTEPASTLWTDVDTNNLRHEGDVEFSNGKKPIKLLSRFLKMADGSKGKAALDFFAGSGTTAHAVIDLNRQDGGKRKYILVEMGDHFDTVLMPRVKKVVYAPDWKDGKPVSTDKGISHCFKYMTLESYEDTLNNLKLEKPGELGILQNEYMLNYMLEIESRKSLLGLDKFAHPFDYTLDLAVDSSGATKPQKVDMVETFNYLIGLRVQLIDRNVGKGYVIVHGELPSGEDALVLWRDLGKVDNAELKKILDKQGIHPREKGFVLYVNGDHNLPNTVKEEGEEKTIKIRSIEADFNRLMFAEA